jgi:cellulose synthase operon protein B
MLNATENAVGDDLQTSQPNRKAALNVRRWGAALAAFVLTAQATAAGQHAPQITPPAPAERELRLTFAELGADAISLQGVLSTAGLDFGVRRDEVVAGAVLHLRLTYSPALLQELSHLRVSLNGQTLAALPLLKTDAAHEVERSLNLDPRLFSDYNHMQLDLVGHYTLECEDPQHSSIWAKISRDSDITLTLRSLELRDDLALLPAPFFDPHDSRRLELPIVLPADASRDIVRSAGIAASWFGMLADYRGARFPVSFDSLPVRHGLVFATNSARPAQLSLPAVQTPTVSMIDNPANPKLKLLVFQGKDATQLRQAVEGLVLGNAVLTGSSASVAAVSYQRRAPYDAPRWVRSDRPVKLGELVDDPEQLQGHGVAPAPMRVNLRLPPDLFTWNKAGVPVDLRYRYTAPASRDNSVLTVSINNQLLRAYRLPPESESQGGGRFLVPLLQSESGRETRGLLIPAFQLASNNEMQFQFSMDFHREAACKEVFVDNTRESLDPDSTVDVSGFPHYTALPNLALFANAGFPFTRYADLAETAVVLPDVNDQAALEELFFVLGRLGRQTGAVALAYRLLDTSEALTAKNVDLLVLAGARSNELLEHWSPASALVFRKAGRDFRELGPARTAMTAAVAGAAAENSAAPRVLIQAGGSLAALLTFESPLSSGRTVVALTGSDSGAAQTLVAALEDESKVPLIRGALAVVRNGTIQSYEGEELYYVGSLSWWQWLWFHFSRHSLLLTLLLLVAATTVGLLLYGGLQRLVTKRLGGRAPT